MRVPRPRPNPAWMRCGGCSSASVPPLPHLRRGLYCEYEGNSTHKSVCSVRQADAALLTPVPWELCTSSVRSPAGLRTESHCLWAHPFNVPTCPQQNSSSSPAHLLVLLCSCITGGPSFDPAVSQNAAPLRQALQICFLEFICLLPPLLLQP